MIKYNEFKALIDQAIQRDSDGKITGVDYGTVINNANGKFNDSFQEMKGKQGDTLENAKKEAVSSFLKESGYESKKSFTDFVSTSNATTKSYGELQGKIKTEALSTSINGIFKDLGIDEKYGKAVSKLLPTEGLYNEAGELSTDTLKENVTNILKDDLMVEFEAVKVGVEPESKTKSNDQLSPNEQYYLDKYGK